MPVARKKSAPPVAKRRAPRPDGQATRDHLVETAGLVIAERGYADSTGKEICQRAGVPLASINYHFGGRDGLYEAVLIAAHQQLVALDDLVTMVEGIDDPAERLRTVLIHLVRLTTRPAAPWGLRVLLREVLAPSAALSALIEKAVRPKAMFLRGLVAGVMKLPPEHPSVQRGLVFTILPCLTLMIIPKQAPARLVPAAAKGAEGMGDDLVLYAMAGLDALARAHTGRRKR